MAKTKKKRKFAYNAPDQKQLKTASTRGGGSYDKAYREDFTLFKAADGKNRIRILPSADENQMYWGHEVFVHNGVGADNSQYPCYAKNDNEPCAVCDAIAEAKREGDSESAFVKESGARKRVLLWVIDRSKEAEGPLLYPAPQSLTKGILLAAEDEDSGELINLDHPEQGNDVVFRKTGTGLGTEYAGAKLMNRASALSKDDDLAEEWLEFVTENPLREAFNKFTYKHIAAALAGGAKRKQDEEEPEDDEDEDSGKDDFGGDASGSKGSRQKYHGDDGDDDEPKKKKKKKKKKSK